jgi:hypothetical protein
MGEVAGVYGCVISETDSGELATIASYLTFGDGQVAFVSDHYRAEEIANYRGRGRGSGLNNQQTLVKS